MTDLLTSLLDELKSFAGTRIAWFLAGLLMSGNDIPAVLNSIRTFVGV